MDSLRLLDFTPVWIDLSPAIPLLVRGAHLAQGMPALTPATGYLAFGGDIYADAMMNLNDTSEIDRPNM